MEGNLSSNDKYLAIDIIINISLGVVIGLIFGYIILKKKIYKGPNSSKITQEKYVDSKGEYVWEPVITICPLGTIHTPH